MTNYLIIILDCFFHVKPQLKYKNKVKFKTKIQVSVIPFINM